MFYSEQKKQVSTYNRRTFFLFLLKLSLFTGVGWRLYNIQILDSSKYKTLSKKNQIDLEILFPIRGKIFDRNKILIANNEKVYEGKSYLKSNEIQINGVNNKTLKIMYKFEKSKGEEIRLLATNSRGYPPDLYGKLQVFDSNSKIYKAEKTIVTSFVEAIFILLIFYCLFSLSIGKNKNDLINFLIRKLKSVQLTRYFEN